MKYLSITCTDNDTGYIYVQGENNSLSNPIMN